MKNAARSFMRLFVATYNSVAAESVLINCFASIMLFIRDNGTATKH